MPHVLVVASQTITSQHLIDAAVVRNAEEPCLFTLLALAVTEKTSTMSGLPAAATNVPYFGSAGADGYELARHQLGLAKQLFSRAGLRVRGEVGDPDPLAAVEKFLSDTDVAVDEIMISTLPSAVSHWLRMDVPSRLRRRLSQPVVVVTGRG